MDTWVTHQPGLIIPQERNEAFILLEQLFHILCYSCVDCCLINIPLEGKKKITTFGNIGFLETSAFVMFCYRKYTMGFLQNPSKGTNSLNSNFSQTIPLFSIQF